MEEREVIVHVENLVKHFPITRGVIFQKEIGFVSAVENITFDIFKGETLGLVGESGCGKSTTGRTILRLYEPTSGRVLIEGKDYSLLKGNELKIARSRMQMIFQDPYSSLDNRMTVEQIISEPMEVHHTHGRQARSKRVDELLEMVGLNKEFACRYPHEFSGGQRQRIGIARALALEPALIICDEPISALDVSVQSQVVNLLADLQSKLRLTYLFIAHDLSMVRHISDRVAVMYLGKIVELATCEELFNSPLHPYSKALLSAVPNPDPEIERKRNRIILQGDVPSPIHPPLGCRFNTRCISRGRACGEESPELIEVSPSHYVACFYAMRSK
jgi:oligopeptide transport system ATP-binding protein